MCVCVCVCVVCVCVCVMCVCVYVCGVSSMHLDPFTSKPAQYVFCEGNRYTHTSMHILTHLTFACVNVYSIQIIRIFRW